MKAPKLKRKSQSGSRKTLDKLNQTLQLLINLLDNPITTEHSLTILNPQHQEIKL